MDEVKVKTKKIEIEVNQEKTDYINYVYNKKIAYWKKAALERERIKRIAGFGAFKIFVEIQTPWKHAFFYMREDCISYFGEPDYQDLELCSKK